MIQTVHAPENNRVHIHWPQGSTWKVLRHGSIKDIFSYGLDKSRSTSNCSFFLTCYKNHNTLIIALFHRRIPTLQNLVSILKGIGFTLQPKPTTSSKYSTFLFCTILTVCWWRVTCVLFLLFSDYNSTHRLSISKMYLI